MPKAPEHLQAAQLSVGICGQGICIEMIDGAGNIICHAHGFGALKFSGDLQRAFLKLGALDHGRPLH